MIKPEERITGDEGFVKDPYIDKVEGQIRLLEAKLAALELQSERKHDPSLFLQMERLKSEIEQKRKALYADWAVEGHDIWTR